MPKISAFILCDSVNNMPLPDGNSVPTLINPQVVLKPQFIPTTFSFGFSVGILDMKPDIQNKVKLLIMDPEESKTVQDLGEIEIYPGLIGQNQPDSFSGCTITASVQNVPIEKQGVYKLSVFVNGQNIGSKDIPIFKGGIS